MQLGALIPLTDIGADPATVREYAQTMERFGYDFLEAPDHVLGVNTASRPDWEAGRNTSSDLFHDPFVLFGFLAGCTTRLGFSTGVLILPQRQTALVAKQAASLDVLCGGRFRLGIGVGWNEAEFIALNENFHNRGRRSEEQVQVMQKLWAEPHVTFKGRWHTIEDAGINPLPLKRGPRPRIGRDRGVDLVRGRHRSGLAARGGVLEAGGCLAPDADHHVQPPPSSTDRRSQSCRPSRRIATVSRSNCR
jgi:alkanesulfonate monooxygenase SsuD/methylene tetrahydromethanopterin reductase-like flavin-dependent oxidoreductase (luciferase family)